MKILVIGSEGMLGADLVQVTRENNEVIGLDIQDLDITNRDKCITVIRDILPDWIINSAAYTAVDDCETNSEAAMRVNAAGAGNLAEAASEAGSRLVHISTDYVFDGTASQPYKEFDTVNPQTVYGETKLEGEKSVQRFLPDNSLIVRTSWLFGSNGNNFIDTILNIASQGKPLRIVSDQTGCPTFTADLAAAIYSLILQDTTGIVHVTNSGFTTWYDFATYFLSKTYPEIDVKPVTTDDFPVAAKRPAYSVLSTARLKMIIGEDLPAWQNAVDRYLTIKYSGQLKEIIK